MTESSEPKPDLPAAGDFASNLGKPVKLTDLQLNGVAAEAARGGETIKVWTRLCLTTDDRFFHRIVEGLSAHIEYRSAQAGHPVSLTRPGFILVVIHPDNTGDLWLDAAAVSIKALVKRPMAAGTVIFETDIADVTAMSFPLVEIRKEDRVLCIFREGWRFALFFDFNPNGDLSIENMERDLGTLHRRLKYRDFYDAIADANVFGRLIETGWFPFVEILGKEFRELASHCEAGFELGEVEAKLLSTFDVERVESMFARWMLKPHFAGKERLLRSALNNFASGDAVAVLKIVLTEIEGILRDAYRNLHGKGAKLGKLLEFAVESAEQRAGHPVVVSDGVRALFEVAHLRQIRSRSSNRQGKFASRRWTWRSRCRKLYAGAGAASIPYARPTGILHLIQPSRRWKRPRTARRRSPR